MILQYNMTLWCNKIQSCLCLNDEEKKPKMLCGLLDATLPHFSVCFTEIARECLVLVVIKIF